MQEEDVDRFCISTASAVHAWQMPGGSCLPFSPLQLDSWVETAPDRRDKLSITRGYGAMLIPCTDIIHRCPGALISLSYFSPVSLNLSKPEQAPEANSSSIHLP